MVSTEVVSERTELEGSGSGLDLVSETLLPIPVFLTITD